MTQSYRLGDLLVAKGVITPNQLTTGLAYQKQHQVALGQALQQLGFVSGLRIRYTLFKQHWLRSIATVVTLFVAPISQTFADQNNLEQLPEYSLTQVAQNPCPYQAFNHYENAPIASADFNVMEVASTAVWYLSQGGVDTEKLAKLPLQISLNSKDLNEELSVNISVKF